MGPASSPENVFKSIINYKKEMLQVKWHLSLAFIFLYCFLMKSQHNLEFPVYEWVRYFINNRNEIPLCLTPKLVTSLISKGNGCSLRPS